LLSLVGEGHDGLGAVDHIVVAVTGGTGADAVQGVVGIGLFMGQRGDQAASDDLFDQGLLGVVASVGQGRAGQHGRGQHGLDHQAAAQGFEHGGDVKAGAAKAALRFGEQGADEAQLGKLGPLLGAVAGGRLGDGVTGFDAVLLGQVAVERISQHATVVGLVEVHGCVPRQSMLTDPGSSWR
jgi:hypothetical protein